MVVRICLLPPPTSIGLFGKVCVVIVVWLFSWCVFLVLMWVVLVSVYILPTGK